MEVKKLIELLQQFDSNIVTYRYDSETDSYYENIYNPKIMYIIKSGKMMTITNEEYDTIPGYEKQCPYSNSHPCLYTKKGTYYRELINDSWIFTIPENISKDKYNDLPDAIKAKYQKGLII